MIRSLLSFVLALGLSLSILSTPSFAFASTSEKAADPAYFQIKEITATEVFDQDAMQSMADQHPVIGENCEALRNHLLLISRVGDSKLQDIDPVTQLQVWVDQIINIGQKIWAVVEAGKPVVSAKMASASALPRGIQCWSDMSGWSMPQSKTYRIQYKNGYNMNVVDFTYRVMFTAGGNVNGVGQYITNATFVPANIYVAWGYKFDANAQVAAVFNHGTKQDPLAGMQMNMQWQVNSPLYHTETTESFFITGDNKLIKMK